MRQIFLIVVFLAAIVSCKKKENAKPVPNEYQNWKGTVSFKRNGVYYEGKSASTKDRLPADTTKLQISVVRLNNEGFLRDNINLGNISPSVKTYILTEGFADTVGNKESGKPYVKYSLALADGDAIMAYVLLESYPHYVAVTSYDSTTKEICGTFEVSCITVSNMNKDTVHFTEGVFHTKVQ